MTIAQILKQIDKATLTKATKLPIREVEEEKKGHWVAFVDEGSESHDVQVVLKGKQVVTTTCDCGTDQEAICNHKVKMLTILEDALKGTKIVDKPVAKKTLTKKKMSESVTVLYEANQEEVYLWFVELFAKEKAVEQEFLLKFKKQEDIDYTAEQVESIILKTITSFFGRRKSASADDVKKFIDLLTLTVEPIDKFLVFNISKPIALDIYVSIYCEIVQLNASIKHTSKRFNTFMELLYSKYTLSLLNVNDKSAVNSSICNLFKKIAVTKWFTSFSFMINLVQEIYLKGDDEIKLFCAREVGKLMSTTVDIKSRFESDVLSIFLSILRQQQLFKDYYHLFEITKDDTKYNQTLLDALLPIDISLVIKHCRSMLRKNYVDGESVGYCDILTSAYELENRTNESARIKMQVFLFNFRFSDYVYISTYLEDKMDLGKFKKKVLDKLSNSYYEEELVYFQVLDYEGKYKKMVESIRSSTPQVLVNHFKELLFKCDSGKFLEQVSRVGQTKRYNVTNNEELAQFIVDNYPKGTIQKMFKKDDKSYYSYSGSLNELIISLI